MTDVLARLRRERAAIDAEGTPENWFAADWLVRLLDVAIELCSSTYLVQCKKHTEMRFTLLPFADAVLPLYRWQWPWWTMNATAANDFNIISQHAKLSDLKVEATLPDMIVFKNDVIRVNVELSKPDADGAELARDEKKIVQGLLDSAICSSKRAEGGSQHVWLDARTSGDSEFVLAHSIRNEGCKLIVSALEPFEPQHGVYWKVDIAALDFEQCMAVDLFVFAECIARLRDSLDARDVGGGGGDAAAHSGYFVRSSIPQTKSKANNNTHKHVVRDAAWTCVHAGERASVWRNGDRVQRVEPCHNARARARARQQRRSHTLAAEHNAAVPLIDSWLDDDKLVLEMVAGEPLVIEQLCDDAFEKLSLSMLECVVRLHAAGVVHLDVKPANFVAVDGEARLIDFESAILLADSTSCMEVYNIICTPAFAAPEAMEGGDHVLVGRPADAFALGRSLDDALQAHDALYTHHTAHDDRWSVPQ